LRTFEKTFDEHGGLIEVPLLFGRLAEMEVARKAFDPALASVDRALEAAEAGIFDT
jgi:hypothetical protein